jgi:Rad3-related DNA helicase
VSFTLRSGDLDASFRSSIRAVDGTRLHQKIQRESGADYKAEVPLISRIQRGDFEFVLEGRADGIFVRDGITYVDEIKSTLKPLLSLSENDQPLHWAQAKCYAYALSCPGGTADSGVNTDSAAEPVTASGSASGSDISASADTAAETMSIGVQLTYIHAETHEVVRFNKLFESQDLTAFMVELTEKYLKWAIWSKDWKALRNLSISALAFPYPYYRSGQRSLAVQIYKSILTGGRLFVQAPTGTGKTMSTLFPAIKALGLGHAEKLFYLTARTTARQAAADALRQMSNRGVRLKVVTLTAKDKICFLDKPSCRPEDCPYAKGHFDRVNEAMFAALERFDALSRDNIAEIAQTHQVCPFELSLDLATWSDVILCDYNYVFDPRVYLKRFFDTTTLAPYVFLIDEAHHLVDRARDMFSATLDKASFLELKKSLKTIAPAVSKAANKVNAQLVTLKKSADGARYQQLDTPPESLLLSLRRFTEASEKRLAEAGSLSPSQNETFEALLTLYFDTLSFLRISELYGPDYITYTDSTSTSLMVKLFCLHPRRLLSEALDRGRASVLFSATLHPLAYFREVSGGQPEDRCIRLPSPFPRENLGIYVYNALSTRYKDRSQTAEQIAELLAITAGEGKLGHYIAFFPSYEYLRLVLASFEARNSDFDTDVQVSSMNDEKRVAFLSVFENVPKRSHVVFAVLGGIFSEGIDLVGDRLSGVMIVGVGLPQLHYENDLLKSYYDENADDGYAYAYQYPGMNKVLQAAGRVIRTENDRGVVLLVDDRFTHARYRRLFPPEWSHYKTLHSPEQLSETLSSFWK